MEDAQTRLVRGDRQETTLLQGYIQARLGEAFPFNRFCLSAIADHKTKGQTMFSQLRR